MARDRASRARGAAGHGMDAHFVEGGKASSRRRWDTDEPGAGTLIRREVSSGWSSGPPPGFAANVAVPLADAVALRWSGPRPRTPPQGHRHRLAPSGTSRRPRSSEAELLPGGPRPGGPRCGVGSMPGGLAMSDGLLPRRVPTSGPRSKRPRPSRLWPSDAGATLNQADSAGRVPVERARARRPSRAARTELALEATRAQAGTCARPQAYPTHGVLGPGVLGPARPATSAVSYLGQVDSAGSLAPHALAPSDARALGPSRPPSRANVLTRSVAHAVMCLRDRGSSHR